MKKSEFFNLWQKNGLSVALYLAASLGVSIAQAQLWLRAGIKNGLGA